MAPAVAGTPPPDGIWRYDNAPTLSTTRGDALFQTLVSFEPGQRNIRSIQGVVMHGTCKEKDGRTLHDALVDFSVNGYTKGIISVRPDGTFAGTLMSMTDTGTHGTVVVKGAFNAKLVSGTVTVHNPHTAYGDCRGTGKFIRAKGVRIS